MSLCCKQGWPMMNNEGGEGTQSGGRGAAAGKPACFPREIPKCWGGVLHRNQVAELRWGRKPFCWGVVQHGNRSPQAELQAQPDPKHHCLAPWLKPVLSLTLAPEIRGELICHTVHKSFVHVCFLTEFCPVAILYVVNFITSCHQACQPIILRGDVSVREIQYHKFISCLFILSVNEHFLGTYHLPWFPGMPNTQSWTKGVNFLPFCVCCLLQPISLALHLYIQFTFGKYWQLASPFQTLVLRTCNTTVTRA